MPKIKESLREFCSRMCKKYPKTFRADCGILFCTVCNSSVTATKHFNVTQHITTSKHKILAQKSSEASSNKTQTLIGEYQQQQTDTYPMDLCKAFLESNIPLKKVC